MCRSLSPYQIKLSHKDSRSLHQFRKDPDYISKMMAVAAMALAIFALPMQNGMLSLHGKVITNPNADDSLDEVTAANMDTQNSHDVTSEVHEHQDPNVPHVVDIDQILKAHGISREAVQASYDAIQVHRRKPAHFDEFQQNNVDVGGVYEGMRYGQADPYAAKVVRDLVAAQHVDPVITDLVAAQSEAQSKLVIAEQFLHKAQSKAQSMSKAESKAE